MNEIKSSDDVCDILRKMMKECEKNYFDTEKIKSDNKVCNYIKDFYKEECVLGTIQTKNT